MGAPDILGQLTGAGLSVTASGATLIVTPREVLTDDLRELIRENKNALLATLNGAEARRNRVLAMLAERPGIRYAVLTDAQADPDAVILTLAIRGKATCELRIPHDRYEPFLLLDLLDRHGATVQ